MPPHPGDVFEFGTSKGLRYALLAHDHPEYGHLLRIPLGAHAERPADLAESWPARTS